MRIDQNPNLLNKLAPSLVDQDIYDLDLEIKAADKGLISETGGGTRTHCSANCQSAACPTNAATCRGTCNTCGVTCMGTCINCGMHDL